MVNLVRISIGFAVVVAALAGAYLITVADRESDENTKRLIYTQIIETTRENLNWNVAVWDSASALRFERVFPRVREKVPNRYQRALAAMLEDTVRHDLRPLLSDGYRMINVNSFERWRAESKQRLDVIWLSPIGFDESDGLAVVYRAYKAGVVRSGGMILLQDSGDTWTIEGEIVLQRGSFGY